MHEGAIGAIFIALLVVAERTAAIGTQRVQRAITKHAIEGLPLRQCMTGVIRTFFVGKYAFIFHGSSYDKKQDALSQMSARSVSAHSVGLVRSRATFGREGAAQAKRQRPSVGPKRFAASSNSAVLLNGGT